MDASFNHISVLEAATFSGFASEGSALLLNISHNIVSVVEDFTFRGFGGHNLLVDVSYNRINTITENTFGQVNRGNVHVNLSHNGMRTIDTGSLSFFNGNNIIFDISNNALSELPTGMFNGSSGQGLMVFDASFNSISTVGDIFDGFSGIVNMVFELSNNNIDSIGVKTFLNSFTGSAASLHVSFQNNSVTTVPGELLTGQIDTVAVSLQCVVWELHSLSRFACMIMVLLFVVAFRPFIAPLCMGLGFKEQLGYYYESFFYIQSTMKWLDKP